MGFWTPEVLDEVRRRSDIVQIISEFVQLRPQGRNLFGLCPFHDDRTPSFSVSPDKQLFYCFGCQASGDVFDFVMRKEGLDFAEGVAALARRAGVALPEREATPEERRRWREREDLFRALAAAADFYHRTLLESPAAAQARRYLEGRGVSAGSRDRFGVGYAPSQRDTLLTVLTRQGFAREMLHKVGLVTDGAGGHWHDRFRDRLMFPIRDDQGRVVAFGGRILGAGEPKYLNSPETPLFNKRRLWFGLDLARAAIRESGRALVMEGYLDVVTAHQYGFTTAVASLGTALSAEQAAALRRHAREAVIAYDADAAGTQATLRGLEVFRKAGCAVRVARVPEGKDPDEFLRARGAEAFQAVIDGALPLVEFIYQLAAAREDLATPEGKAGVVSQVVPALAAEENEVARAAYINQLSARLGIAEEALRRELKKYARAVTVSQSRPQSQKTVMENSGGTYNKRNGWDDIRTDSAYREAERRLLSLFLRYPEQREGIRRALSIEDFEEEDLRPLAEFLWSRQGSPVAVRQGTPAAGLPLEVTDAALRELAAALIMEEAEFPEPGRAVADCVERLLRHRHEREKEALEAEFATALAAGLPIPLESRERWRELHRSIRGSS